MTAGGNGALGVPTIVADLAAGEAETLSRLDVAEATLRARGITPVGVRVRGAAEVAAAIGPSTGDRYPVVLGDDRSIRAAIASLAGARVTVTGSPPGDRPGSAGAPGPVLGVLAAGPHVDFVRTFGIPPDQPVFASERLLTAPPYPIDVAEVTYVDHSGSEAKTHFAGLAEIGFGGAVIRREARARIRRTAAFSAYWLTEATFRGREIRVTGEHREFVGRSHDVIVGNTQYGRHGIRLSPRSFPGDGALDLLVMTGPKWQQVRLLPRMFQGEHLPDESIREFRARRITVECEHPLPLHADGEFLGTTPVRFELLPHAITLRI
jgi:diacylglycerol kinase family enzyme